MKLKIKNGFIYSYDCEEPRIIGTVDVDLTEEEQKVIELGSELVQPVISFVENVKSGKFKPRHEVKIIDAIIEKYS